MPPMPIGTDTMNTRRQSTAASTPPRIRPMNMPEMPATWLMPIAVPRWSDGNASVRIAGELAISIAPPMAWMTRKPISHSAPGRPGQRVERQDERAEAEDREPGVVHPHPAVDVAQPAEGDHQHGRHDQVAHQHPEQVADVARGQRVELDAAEDGRQRDDHDRGVDGGRQHAQRGVGQRQPLVVRSENGPRRSGRLCGGPVRGGAVRGGAGLRAGRGAGAVAGVLCCVALPGSLAVRRLAHLAVISLAGANNCY